MLKSKNQNLMILVGYEPNGYKVWLEENDKFVTVRDVIVDEINFKTSRPIGIKRGEIHDNSENEYSKFVKYPKETDAKSDQLKSDQMLECFEPSIKTNAETEKLNSNNTEQIKSCRNNEKNNKLIRRSDRNKNIPPLSYNEKQYDE